MDILVYGDWLELKETTLIGMLSLSRVKGRSVFSFSYEREWLKDGHAQNLDPDIQPFAGLQYLPAGKQNFGMFLDSSPNRWGQSLMKRKEALVARQEKRNEKTLFPEDYLLRVLDLQRMGGLRFKLSADGPFLQESQVQTTSPWTSLKELEFASLQLEKEEMNDADLLKWLNVLLAPGASLGGARPKAGVTDEKGNLWIAKFPKAADLTDIGGWEMLINELAESAGMDVAAGQAKKLNHKHHTFLTRRFDRIGTKRRIHFASAMTLLGREDGALDVSYLDIASFIIKNGADIKKDLEELWRRIVFNIAIKNTDDHLRNHGFLLSAKGWSLSPAYDMNPNSDGKGLTLNISQTDNSLDFELALSVARYFRVEKDADSIIKKVTRSVGKWRDLAKKYGIPESEVSIMAPAFENSW
jgi:serine/threonine-protein kinase HipA